MLDRLQGQLSKSKQLASAYQAVFLSGPGKIVLADLLQTCGVASVATKVCGRPYSAETGHKRCG